MEEEGAAVEGERENSRALDCDWRAFHPKMVQVLESEDFANFRRVPASVENRRRSEVAENGRFPSLEYLHWGFGSCDFDIDLRAWNRLLGA